MSSSLPSDPVELDPGALLGRAAALAARGRGAVEPNPCVGALALCGDRVVGEGWHARYGGAHAEERALEDAFAHGAEPDTLVVTLEPCSSIGPNKKRPPCTQLLIDAGIERVLIGARDSDPRHEGKGFATLAAAGIAVDGPFDLPVLDDLLCRFRLELLRSRPWVLAKWAMTLDGKTATRTGSSQWISDEHSLGYAHELRASCDALVVGIGTALADDPELTTRRFPGPTPLRVVVDPEAALPTRARLLATTRAGPVRVFVAKDSSEAARAALVAAGAEVVPITPARYPGASRPGLDLPEMLRSLHADGCRRVVVEGGGGLVADLLHAGCLDQVEAVVAAKLCGGRSAKSPVAGLGIAEMADAVELSDTYLRSIGRCWLFGGFLDASVDGSCA